MQTLFYQSSEEESQKWSGQVKTFVAVVIAVVKLTATWNKLKMENSNNVHKIYLLCIKSVFSI